MDNGYREFAVLKVPGFKVLGYDELNDGKWNNIHTGADAAAPYVNEHRWWTGITEYHVAEFVALKSKIHHWKGRKQHRDYKVEKFNQYLENLDLLFSNYGESTIYKDIYEYPELRIFLPKKMQDIFVF